jgi:hypothetical protein
MMAARSEIASVANGQSPAAALLSALGRLAIVEWSGVAGEDGELAELTPANIDALLDLWPIAEAFERLYLAPALLLDTEKNASGPGPNGISAAGPSTAEAAA